MAEYLESHNSYCYRNMGALKFSFFSWTITLPIQKETPSGAILEMVSNSLKVLCYANFCNWMEQVEAGGVQDLLQNIASFG